MKVSPAVYNLRRDCHKLLDVIWGKDKAARTLAYTWLHQNCSGPVHFSTIFEVDRLEKIKAKLEHLRITEKGKYLKQYEPAVESDWGVWVADRATRRVKKKNKNRLPKFGDDSWGE